MFTTLYASLQAAGLTASVRCKREVLMNVDIYFRAGGPFGVYREVNK